MKRFLILAAAAAALSSCQTDAQVRSGKPFAQFKTAKNANDAVACLIPSIEKSYNAVAIERWRFVAQTLVPNREYDIVPTTGLINGHYLYTVNVKQTASGSDLTMYTGQFVMPFLTKGITDGIRGC